MSKTQFGIGLVVVGLIVATGALAATIERGGPGDLDGTPAPANECQVDNPSDCSVFGDVRTADDGKTVGERVEIQLVFGPSERLLGRLSVLESGTGTELVFQNGTGTESVTERIALESGSESTRYATASIGGYDHYSVFAAVTNSDEWEIATVDERERGGEQRPSTGESDGLDSMSGVAEAGLTFGADGYREPVHFELEPANDSGQSSLFPAVDRFHLGLAILAVAGVGLVALFALSGGSGAGERAVHSSDDDESDREALARIARDAADRIENEPAPANAIYRAWTEMTDALDVSNPDATTAGEFVEAAVEAGLDEDDVALLTRLFEDVRYGDRDPAEYEDRALETMRRIERTYRGEATEDER